MSIDLIQGKLTRVHLQTIQVLRNSNKNSEEDFYYEVISRIYGHTEKNKAKNNKYGKLEKKGWGYE